MKIENIKLVVKKILLSEKLRLGSLTFGVGFLIGVVGAVVEHKYFGTNHILATLETTVGEEYSISVAQTITRGR